jgi:hypothetical protein
LSASLSPRFLADLAQVYASLQPQPLSAVFLADLAQVYTTLPTASDADLQSLASQFEAWRENTREFVRRRVVELDKDDPLLCPISLFRTMDFGRLETAHTRTLAWLLDPKKDEEHGFGSTLLAALLGWVAGHNQFDRLHVEEVASEFPLEGGAGKGRLDVLANGEWEIAGERVPWTLTIEAKVDAWEDEGQLDKYDDWLNSHAVGRETYRVFLTPNGRLPESGCDEWNALSFLELAQVFRKALRQLIGTPGFHFLRFYLAGVLQDICGLPRKVTADAPDPYAVASYLKAVHDSHSGSAKHDAAR